MHSMLSVPYLLCEKLVKDAAIISSKKNIFFMLVVFRFVKPFVGKTET